MELKTTQNFRHNTPLTKNMTCALFDNFVFYFSFGEMSSHFPVLTVQKKMTKMAHP